MALTGHLSDLSLSELIEFFCNQRKSGRLKVLYPNGAGYFYLHSGSVVDARIGVLHGIDAVYYALTLPNAEFQFSVDAETFNRTINQPWTQVVLEGLRRLDENVPPGVAFPPGFVPEPDELETEVSQETNEELHKSFGPGFLAFVGKETMGQRRPLFIGAIAVAILGSVAAIGVPAGWYHSKKVEAQTAEVVTQAPVSESTQTLPPAQPQPEPSNTTAPVDEADSLAARRVRERERKTRETRSAGNEGVAAASTGNTLKPGAKRVVVTVTYDESGRVTQASGGDANALRIARQKRFPPGKGGSATVSIPIN
jgi:hypothetical protein